MTTYTPLRQLPAKAGYKAGDVLVLFGELFGRGYANGIVDEARRSGMTVIGITMGRRDAAGQLRPLTAEELAEAEANLGGKMINLPLEAGFDMEGTPSPVEQLKGVKGDEWDQVKLDWQAIERSKEAGVTRFKTTLTQVVVEIAKLLPAKGNVLFAHTMAGGIPRARIFMPLLNRVFKGVGERYLSSEQFWGSELGRLCQISFDEVTADTFGYLIEATADLRSQISTKGGEVRYVAYGYHGCEVLIDGSYAWQSYTPYLQGWAKIRLEEVAARAWQQGVKATVFNCPEILTNSSALFLGVEISLYPLLTALSKEGGGEKIRSRCQSLLKEGMTLDQLLTKANDYLASPRIAQFRKIKSWPHHNSPEQAEFMLASSAELLAMNADPKEIVCAELSRQVFSATGQLMLHESWAPTASTLWLNHDIVARQIVARG
jgi:hypothetical protein